MYRIALCLIVWMHLFFGVGHVFAKIEEEDAEDQTRSSEKSYYLLPHAPHLLNHSDPVTPTDSPIKFSAMLDVYYSYNFTHPQKTLIPTLSKPGLAEGQATLRNFDIYHDSITINYAEFGIKKSGDEIDFLLKLVFGQSIEQVLSPFNHIDEAFKNIGEAFVNYSPKSIPGLSFKFGKMLTHIGFEFFKSSYNWQYSRSNLYGLGVPDWHLGLATSYSFIPDKVKATVFIYNGWNIAYNSSGEKTIGFELIYTPSDGTWIDYDLITGPEQSDFFTQRKTVHDICFQLKLNPEWSVATSILYGEALNGTYADIQNITNTLAHSMWFGGTAAFKFSPFDQYYISPRFEVYRDAQGYTTTIGPRGVTLSGVTLTQSYTIKDGLQIRLEARKDFSTEPIFERENKSLEQSQSTATFAVLYTL